MTKLKIKLYLKSIKYFTDSVLLMKYVFLIYKIFSFFFFILHFCPFMNGCSFKTSFRMKHWCHAFHCHGSCERSFIENRGMSHNYSRGYLEFSPTTISGNICGLEVTGIWEGSQCLDVEKKSGNPKAILSQSLSLK